MKIAHARFGLLFHAGLYILAVLAANATAETWIYLPLMQISVGTLFFGVTFTQRDRIHRYGRRAVYLTIALAAILNTFESLLLGIPARIIAASFLAIVLAELADTEVYQRQLARPWLARVAASNAVSIPIDATLFTFVAFAGVPEYPLLVLLAIIAGDVVLKAVVGLVVALWRPRDDGHALPLTDPQASSGPLAPPSSG